MADIDVAIVGGGIVGCVIARQLLAADPSTSIAIIDRAMAGAGATKRSAGLHFPRGASPAVRELSDYSQRYWTELAAGRPELPIHPLPMTLVASRDRADAARSAFLPGADLRPVADVPELVGGLPAGSVGWQVSGAHYADVHALTQLLAAELRASVRVIEGTRVTALTSGADGVDVEFGDGRSLRAGRVVLAPGPWLADPAWRELVAPLGARVKKVVAMHIAQPPGPGAQVVSFHDEDAFLLPLVSRGHWLFSYTCTIWDVDPDELSDSLTGEDFATALEVLTRLAPNLAPFCDGGRVFCDAYSTDREPIVQALNDTGHIIFAGACNGAGYRLAPAIAARAAELVRAEALLGSRA